MLREWLMVHDGNLADNRLEPSMEGSLVNIVVTQLYVLNGDDFPTEYALIDDKCLPFADLGPHFFNVGELTLSQLQSLDHAEDTLQALNSRIGAFGACQAIDRGDSSSGDLGIP